MSSSSSVATRTLGPLGPTVTAEGFGLMGLSIAYGSKPMSDEERFKLLDKALELGQTFWDTADVYGDNEELLGKYFKKNPEARSKIFLASKFGHVAGADGSVSIDSSPEYAKKALDASLQKLGVDCVDLYYVHRVDTKTPIEKTIEALVEAKNAGKLRYIGVSEVSARTLRRAAKVHHITAVQLEYSPFEVEAELDDERFGVIKAAKELGTAVVCYSPLGRGMITGQYKTKDDFEDGDFRKYLDRFSDENFPKALKLVAELAEVGKAHGATPGQVALAWLIAQGDHVVPIPGTRKVKYLEENMAALQLKLSDDDVKRVRKAIENQVGLGERYPEGAADRLFADTPEL